MENQPNNFPGRSPRIGEEEKETPEGKSLLSLPYDLLEEKIVLKLPLKALLTCRCVSKYFRTIISDPNFMQHYNACTHTSLFLRIAPSPVERAYLSFQLFDLQNDCHSAINTFRTPYFNPCFIQVSSCNGLVCISSFYSRILLICNPVWGEYITLPIKPDKGLALIGFSPRTGEYIVLFVIKKTIGPLYHGAEAEFEAKVYVIGGFGSWTSVGMVPPGISFADTDFYNYVNGAFHWPSTTCSRGGSYPIWAFSFDELKFQEVPKGERFGRTGMRIGVLNGWLCVCDAPEEPSLGIDVWVMKEYGVEESWTKLFNINNSMMIFNDCLSGFGVLSDGRILMMSKHCLRESAMSYDPQTGVLNSCFHHVINDLEDFNIRFHFIEGAPTLLSVRNLAPE